MVPTKVRLYGDCLILLERCNWSCKYCYDDRKKFIIDEPRILKELLAMKHLISTQALSGGEPGLLSEWFWDQLFSQIDTAAIYTNGTFVLKGYADKYAKQIREVMIHCVEELDQEINPKIIDYTKRAKQCIFSIVIHNDNVHLLDNFLKKYKQFDFRLFFADDYHVADMHIPRSLALTKESAEKVLKVLNQYTTYAPYSNQLIKGIISGNYFEMNKCKVDDEELMKSRLDG